MLQLFCMGVHKNQVKQISCLGVMERTKNCSCMTSPFPWCLCICGSCLSVWKASDLQLVDGISAERLNHWLRILLTQQWWVIDNKMKFAEQGDFCCLKETVLPAWKFNGQFNLCPQHMHACPLGQKRFQCCRQSPWFWLTFWPTFGGLRPFVFEAAGRPGAWLSFSWQRWKMAGVFGSLDTKTDSLRCSE